MAKWNVTYDTVTWNAAIDAALAAYKDGFGAIAALKVVRPVTVDHKETQNG